MTIHDDIARRVDTDGQVWFDSGSAAELLLRGFDLSDLNVEVSPETETFNQWCERKDKSEFILKPNEKPNTDRLNTWWLSDEFRNLPLRETIIARCQTNVECERAQQELDLFEERGLFPVLRQMFMLVDHFRRNNILWGVGRGSSVSSFVLYKIGVHRLNPMLHGLEISEFLRE